MTIPVIQREQTGPDGRVGLLVRTEYLYDFAEALKQEFPRRDRLWSQEQEAWWVAVEHLDRVQQLCIEYFNAARVIDGDGVTEEELVRDGQGISRQERLFE